MSSARKGRPNRNSIWARNGAIARLTELAALGLSDREIGAVIFDDRILRPGAVRRARLTYDVRSDRPPAIPVPMTGRRRAA